MAITYTPDEASCIADDWRGFPWFEMGSGPIPILLLHGLFGSPSNWLPVMRSLAENHHFIALQLPIEFKQGHPHSAFKSFGQLTDHVARFLDEMEIDRAVICGNSLGGQVALDFHLNYPERVESLVLSGSAGLFERSLSGNRPPRVCRQFVREQAAEIFHDKIHISDNLVDEMYAMLSDRHYRRFLLRVAKASRDRCMLDELPSVRVPTAIIWGRNDLITPPHVAELFRDNIHNARLVFIEECGHAPPIERPEEFARLLHAFLSNRSSDRDTVPCKPK